MITTLLVLAAAASNPIEVGRFDSSAFPNAVKVDRRMPQEELTARADRIMQSGRCSFPGQTVDEYAIDVPYAVLLQPWGEVSKVVVKEVGCPELELLTGQVANELARAHDFRPTKAAAEQWYVSEVYYAHGGKAFALRQADDDKIVCENSKLDTGSRLAKSRLCLTKAQWRVYRVEQDKIRRDMLIAGANTSSDPPLRPERGPGDPR
jgi:hypothetical protein